MGVALIHENRVSFHPKFFFCETIGDVQLDVITRQQNFGRPMTCLFKRDKEIRTLFRIGVE